VAEPLTVLRLTQNAVRSFQDHLLQKVFCKSSRCVRDLIAIFLVSCSLLYHTAALGKIKKAKTKPKIPLTKTQQPIVQLEVSLPRVIKCFFFLFFRISFPEVLANLG